MSTYDTRPSRPDGPTGPRTGREILLGGTVAGLVAGLVMAVVGMLWLAIVGAGFWTLPEWIAATWYGPSAMQGGIGVVLVGVLTHLVVSAAWGILFALFVGRRTSGGTALVVGLLYGVFVWAFMTWLVLPWVDPVMYQGAMMVPWAWFVFHLVFGGTLLATPAVERWAAGAEHREPPMRPA